MNRRNFIKQTGLAGTALLLAPYLAPAYKNAKTATKVIIIGAGFAGMAAAYKLSKKRIPFIVLESRDRIGGRVFSHPISKDLIIELGGEWVGQSHTRIQELCSELRLDLQNNQFDTHLIYKGAYAPAGKWDYSPAWNQKWKQILKAYPQLNEADKIKLDQYDWWHYLVNNGCDGRDLDIRELLDSTDFGESIRQVSAFAALAEYAESSPKNEMDYKIKGGNAKLANSMAWTIGQDNIFLNHHVTKIIQGDSVVVQCSNGREIEGEYLICTTPTFALNRIEWKPTLPDAYTDAINQLQYARINKHALHFKERFWKDESFDLISDQGPQYFYHATKNQPSADGGVLIAYSIGDKGAMNANQPNDFQASAVFRCLSPHFGKINNQLLGQVNYYWGNDKYSRGAYALYGPGQWFKIRPILSKSFLRTQFAGEHLADWQGFMEGAVQTGEAAAENIIAG